MTNDSKLTYTWDGENRLTKVEETGKLKEEFTYDYMNRKVTEKVYSWVSGDWSLTADLKRVYDGWNLIALVNATDNSLLKLYTWGEDLSGTLQGAGGVGGLLHETNSSGTYYPIYDGNGNIMVYVNSSGTSKASYEYGPMGKVTSQYGAMANDFNFMFSTKENDRNTDILFYQLRPLKVDIARWLSRDPIGERGGTNLYRITGNDTVNKLDKLGLASWAAVAKLEKNISKKIFCLLRQLGYNENNSSTFRNLLNLYENGKVYTGQPLGLFSGEEKEEVLGEASVFSSDIYLNYTLLKIDEDEALRGLLSTAMHEAQHIHVPLLGPAQDIPGLRSLPSFPRNIEDEVINKINQAASEHVATYHCCDKNNNIIKIKVSKWDQIKNECGIDTTDCSTRNATLIRTSFP